jgi:hypothetical protein
MSAMSCNEMMALKATDDPMLISESRQVIVQVNMTEFSGIVEFRTYITIQWIVS